MRGAPLAVHLLSLGFLLGIVSPGCREGSGFSALRKSRDVAEKYLELLKKQDYESAIALTTPRLSSQLTSEGLRSDLESRFGGHPIQAWTLLAEESVPRRASFLYEVHGGTMTRRMAIVVELSNRWRIASVTNPNDEAATQRALEARVVADKMLENLRAHGFLAAYAQTSPLFQRKMSVAELETIWRKFEGSFGNLKKSELVSSNETTGNFEGKIHPYTMLMYRLEGDAGHAAALLTMIRTAEDWRVEGLNLRDSEGPQGP